MLTTHETTSHEQQPTEQSMLFISNEILYIFTEGTKCRIQNLHSICLSWRGVNDRVFRMKLYRIPSCFHVSKKIIIHFNGFLCYSK